MIVFLRREQDLARSLQFDGLITGKSVLPEKYSWDVGVVYGLEDTQPDDIHRHVSESSFEAETKFKQTSSTR